MTRKEQIAKAADEEEARFANTETIGAAFVSGALFADMHPLVKDNEYIALRWPEIQEYMESPRWDEVGYDPKKDLWFVSKNMVYEGK